MALGTTSVDGLISGLDTTSIIKSLADVRRRPIALLNQRISERTAAYTSYQSLAGQVLALQANAAAVADGSVLQARTVKVSDGASLLAYAATGAPVGTYEVVVDRLAEAHKLASAVVSDPAAPLDFAGDIIVNGRPIAVTADDSLNDVCQAINQAGAGVNATVLHISDAEHRLVLTALETGAGNAIDLLDANAAGFLQSLGLLAGEPVVKHAIASGAASDYLTSKLAPVATALGLSVAPAGTVTINGQSVDINLAEDTLEDIAARISEAVVGVTATVTSVVEGAGTRYRLELVGAEGTPVLTDAGGVMQALGLQAYGAANELQAAQDARIYVDGFLVERPTNQIDNALDGLSLDLLHASPDTPVTLTVASDPEAAVTAMQRLVSSYNAVVSALNAGLTFDTETGEGGAFLGDFAVAGVQAQLHTAAMSAVATLGGSLTLPSQLGLSVDKDGLLALNAETLRSVLASDPEGVVRLLSNRVELSSSEVELVSTTTETADSGPSGYAITITHPATQATARSASLAGGIIRDETLTINGRYSVTLQAGDSLQRAVDRLNAVFEGNGLGLRALVEGDELLVQSKFYGSHYRISISSSLERGVGGTDLGGAAPGTEAVYTGEDVQGTIAGEAADGWGQWLTATTGAAKGLKLRIPDATAGDKGVVKVSQGLASRLTALSLHLTDAKVGTLTQAAEAVDGTIKSLQEEITRLEKSAQAYTETLQAKFAAIEGIMAKNSALQSYLTSQISGLRSLQVSRDA
ncbi:MAG: flagellar filament capping protein FliD [Armatimonadetes bacterium]|nr:flagellar filament capping protein FliD [Armatimonadota bacterium]